jgi:hypothetical protein
MRAFGRKDQMSTADLARWAKGGRRVPPHPACPKPGSAIPLSPTPLPGHQPLRYR